MLIFTDGGATLCPTSVQSKQSSLWSAEFGQTSIYGRLNANGVLSYRNRCLHRRSSANSEDHGYYSTGFIETPIIDSTDSRDRYHTETQSWFMRQLLNPLLFVVLFFYLRQRDALRFVPNTTEVMFRNWLTYFVYKGQYKKINVYEREWTSSTAR